MIVICAGMYRSRSTWQYQVARELLQRAGRDHEAHGFLHSEEIVRLLALTPRPQAAHLLKTHDVTEPLRQSLHDADAVVLYCYRDLRDVVYSMMHKSAGTFSHIVDGGRIVDRSLEAFRFWTSRPRVLIQRYEDFPDREAQCVGEVAAALGVRLQAGESERIASDFGLDAQRRRLDALQSAYRQQGLDLQRSENAMLYDPESLLHWNHIRSGEAGDWRRRATPEETRVLRDKLGDWLIATRYEVDHSWAERDGAGPPSAGR